MSNPANESFLVRTARKIKKEAPRRLKELKLFCDEIIDNAANDPNYGSTLNQDALDALILSLRTCCESRYPRLMEVGLISLHYLMEHGHVSDGRNFSSSDSKKLLIDYVVETISQCSDENDDVVQLQVVKALLTAVTSQNCEVHEASLLLAVRSCFHIHLITKNVVNKTTAKAALTQMLSVINQRMEKFEIKSRQDGDDVSQNFDSGDVLNVAGAADPLAAVTSSDGDASNDITRKDPANLSFPSIMHKDAFLIFRALCKLSMKGLHDDAISESSDMIAMQNKILSLELIFHILQQSGPAFRSGEKFIYAIRHYLCVSLLSNCTSQVNQVTGLSLQIFVLLMDGFKDHLKSELEVFVTNIFLKILESENSSYDHKLRVLEVFHIICTEPSAMVEIFINYDCDLEAIDLFRRFVDGFAKIAKNPSCLQSSRGIASDFLSSSSASKKMTPEEHSLRVKGLEGLVIVLRSLLRSANLWGDAKESGSDKANMIINTESEDSAPVASASAASLLFPPSPANGDGPGDSFESLIIPDHLNAVEIFDRKQKMQEELETGILKFNLSAKKGLQYLSSLGHIEMTPKSVATFLHNYQDRLDKAAVGEYLGREREYENGFCLKVLHEYVELMDFTGMAFDLAIRYFLNGFRLPGEAQKIDRLMEKFAERYYLQNRETFASADMAFILAFSTIMLQTNLHNPAIRDDKRMTKEQFIKQNKGISSDGELSDDMLSEIYDRIAAQPIEISQNDKFKPKAKKEENFVVFQPSNDKRRKEAFNDERKEMVRASEAMFKQKSARGSVYIRNVNSLSDEAYARPMFDVVWAPILGVLSQILETSDDNVTVDLCLISFQYAIRLACRLEFSTARNTFVNALSKFTALDSIREIQKKNVDCIKVLLDIALSEGDYLEESWSQELQAISQLSRLMLASGARGDDQYGDTSDPVNSRSSRRLSSITSSKQLDRSAAGGLFSANMEKFTSLFSGPSKAETVRLVEEQNSELISKEINPVLLDRVFINSQNLSADSVLHFVSCLCQVSMLEISSSSSMNSIRQKASASTGEASSPRVFSLQKLVEVADYNMGSRPRLAWAKMWALLAQHFAFIGVHDNHALAMCAIDSLKQLSIKFLQKDELSNFNFQRVFLKPFEIIISKSKFAEIKDLVLRCIDIMIRSCATNIRSGWKSIFAIFEVAAGQDVLEIANIAFDITERLMNQQFQLLIFDFVELMNCLVSFVASQHTALSLKALAHLARCADHLADGSVSPALENADGMKVESPVAFKDAQIDQDASVFRLWWPLLLGLATRVGDSRLTVRLRALETLNQVLRGYGHLFSPQTWSVIFKGVLFPMVDSAKTDLTQQPQSVWPSENPAMPSDRQSWIGTMASAVFDIYLELFQLFNRQVSEARLLPEVLNTIESCICQETESLARLAVNALSKFVSVTCFEEGKESLLTETGAADLVSSRLSRCVLQNLCVHFGSEAGFLEVLEDTPVATAELLNECPLSKRRRSKEGDSTESRVKVLGSSVVTAYGCGEIIEVLPAYEELAVGPRNVINMKWGKLFSVDRIPDLQSAYTEHVTDGISDEQVSWRQISGSVMTCMVVSLDLIPLLAEATRVRYSSWSSAQISRILSALEASHWHGRSFNDNDLLRKALHRMGFMRFSDSHHRLPHLLEQEVQTIHLIIDSVTHLYSDKAGLLTDGVQVASFASDWVARMGGIALRRYVTTEAEVQTNEDPIALEFARLKQQMYKPTILLLLRAIQAFSELEFSLHKSWIVPMIPQLVLCDDKQVRGIISDIVTVHVNPLVLC